MNQSGKCEGPGGGDRRGALCTGFTLVNFGFKRLFRMHYMSLLVIIHDFFNLKLPMSFYICRFELVLSKYHEMGEN